MTTVFTRTHRAPWRTRQDAQNSSKRSWLCRHCGTVMQPPKPKHCPSCSGSAFFFFPSTGERSRYLMLAMLEREGDVVDLRCQSPECRFPIYILDPGGLQHLLFTYVADFVYEWRDGRKIVEDYKGSLSDDASTALFRLKRKAVETQYGIEITISTGR